MSTFSSVLRINASKASQDLVTLSVEKMLCYNVKVTVNNIAYIRSSTPPPPPPPSVFFFINLYVRSRKKLNACLSRPNWYFPNTVSAIFMNRLRPKNSNPKIVCKKRQVKILRSSSGYYVPKGTSHNDVRECDEITAKWNRN